MNSQEIVDRLKQGERLFLQWPKGQFNTAPAEILGCDGQRILIDHWKRQWVSCSEPAIQQCRILLVNAANTTA